MDKAGLFGREWDCLTGGGGTRVQFWWRPSSVPATCGDQILVEETIAVQEVAVGSTSIQDSCTIVVLSVPFPGTCVRFHWRVSAVHR